ncbi:MAG TPA: MFS transporter [Gammaproteobacteria bacterium]|nr:MFS transporter [Gammaproteobacteria bacterium]
MSTTTDAAANRAATAASTTAIDKPAYQYYVLLMLFFGYIFNVIDRSSVLGAVLPSIKKEIAASNFLMGLLGGLAFSVFYSFLGIPLARLADRWSRVNVLALSVALWSAATATCGLAWNYLSLFTSRAFTAIGEAGGSPPSHSLISDYFPRSKRATALAVYAMAVPIGTSIGNALAGWFNVWYGWRMTFVLVGIPGVLFAALIWLTIKEPPRGYSDGPAAKPRAAAPPFFAVFKFLLARNSFMHMSVAAALHSLVWYSGTTWNTSFFVWRHELNTGQAGNYLAIFSLIGAIGSFAGGYLSDRLSTKHGDPRWYMWVPGIACVVMVPFQVAAYLSHDLGLIVPITFSMMFLLASMFFGPSFAVAQAVATVRMRAVSASVLLFIQTIIGMTLGPAIVGRLSDVLEPTFGQGAGIAYPMAAIGVVNLWAAVHYVLAARRYREDLAETAKLNAAQA